MKNRALSCAIVLTGFLAVGAPAGVAPAYSNAALSDANARLESVGWQVFPALQLEPMGTMVSSQIVWLLGAGSSLQVAPP